MPHPEAAPVVIPSETPPGEQLSAAQKDAFIPVLVGQLLEDQSFSDAPEIGSLHRAVITDGSRETSFFLDRTEFGMMFYVGTTHPETAKPHFLQILTGDRAVKESGNPEPIIEARYKDDVRYVNTVDALAQGGDLLTDALEWTRKGYSLVVDDRVEALREVEVGLEAEQDGEIELQPDEAVQMHLPSGELVAAGR